MSDACFEALHVITNSDPNALLESILNHEIRSVSPPHPHLSLSSPHISIESGTIHSGSYFPFRFRNMKRVPHLYGAHNFWDSFHTVFKVRENGPSFVASVCLIQVRPSSFHDGEDSSRDLLHCNTVKCCSRISSFRRTLLPPSSG
jgi:hypothetical protein